MNAKYIVQVELDNHILKDLYPNDDYKHAYNDIRGFLNDESLDWISGPLFDAGPSPISAVLAVQHLSAHFDWFKGSVKELKLLRVTNMDDLLNVI